MLRTAPLRPPPRQAAPQSEPSSHGQTPLTEGSPPAQEAPAALLQPSAAPSNPNAYVNAYSSGSTVVTFQRTERGQLLRKELPADHCLFLRKTDVSARLRQQLVDAQRVVGVRDEGDWLRVSFTDSETLRRVAAKDGFFASALALETFEGDIDPLRRWMLDNRIAIQKPRRAYLDFEADSRTPFRDLHLMRTLAWSVAELVEDRDVVTGEVHRKAITVATGVLEANTDEAEGAMLRALWRVLADFDQVVSWNGARFDFPLFFERSRRTGAGAEWNRWLWLDHMVAYLRLNMSASESGDEKQFTSLGAIAAEHLGEKKTVDLATTAALAWKMWAGIVTPEEHAEIGSLSPAEQRKLLATYCADDALKMAKIEAKTGYLELHHTLCDSTGIFPDTNAIGPKGQVETFLMRLGHDRGMRFPTAHHEITDDSQFKGADVIEVSNTGIVKNVHVADFARLYPSIIVSWNMSPDTWVDYSLEEDPFNRPSYLRHLPLRKNPLPEGCCYAPTTKVVFRREPQGLLPAAVTEMLRLRKHWDDLKASLPPGTEQWKEADRRSAAYKISANSFYGVIGSKFSRFFKREVAESVARTGAWLLQSISRAAEKRGYRVVYGDTDSVFVTQVTRSGFAEFVEWCNRELFPPMLAECLAPHNSIKLAYEKAFELVLFVSSKRYAGRYEHFKGANATAKSKPEIKGIEYKRGDTAKLARQLQAEVLDRILGGGLLRDRVEYCETNPVPFEELLNVWRDRVLMSELARDEVVIAKKLTKALSEYERKKKQDGTDAALPAHVEIALLLSERGRDVGAGVRIEYVVTDGNTTPQKKIPAEDWKEGDGFDRYYLWDDLIYPATQRLLEAAFPAGRWKDWARTRPPKPRTQAAKLEAAGQAAMFGSAPATKAPTNVAPAPAKKAPPLPRGNPFQRKLW